VAACGACHAKVLEEWAGSLHARAWTNSGAREATSNFTKTGCRACHSPLPVFETGLDQKPNYRDFNQDDGVHCLSCHGLAGGVAAARDLPEAPCNPKKEPRLQSVSMCYPCHQPTHQAFDEYWVSKAAAAGTRCVDCHMPPRADGPGRTHGNLGGLNANFVKKAIETKLERTAPGARLVVTNKTGHKFPGEIPSRSFVVKVTPSHGEPIYTTLRKPNKGEDREDNRLAPDESRAFDLAAPAGAEIRRVELLFKPFPLMPDEAAFVLGAW
jgi:hypothetical protein